MGVLKKEVIILKEGTMAQEYLDRIKELYKSAPQSVKPVLEKEIKITQYGIIGENNILYELKNSGMDMVVLHDIYLKSGDQTAQIDFLVITPILIFVLECKNLIGTIEINSRGEFIRSYIINGKTIREGFYSPITQNERHLALMKKIKMDEQGVIKRAATAKLFSVFHKSLVVLANPKTVLDRCYATKDIKQAVIRADQLISVIKKMNSLSKEMKSGMSEMKKNGERWLSRCVDYDGYEKRYNRFLQMVERVKYSELNNISNQRITTTQPEHSVKETNTAAERLKSIKDLYDARLITEEEYQNKKKEIIASI